jgi:hypothetical protein
LELSANPYTGKYEFFVNGSKVFSYDNYGFSSLQNVIFNNLNLKTDNTADEYYVKWTNFYTGKLQFNAPANLRLNGDKPCGYATNVNFITPTWNAIDRAVSYNYTVTLNGNVIVPVTNVGDVTSVSGAFGGEGLSTFSVQAVATSGATSDWAPMCAVTYDKTAPATPSLQTPTNNAVINTNAFWFDWTDVADKDHYEFQASQTNATDSNGSLISNVWHGDASGNEPSDSRAWSAGANGTWYWQVRAVDVAGNKSGWTAPWKLTIDISAPVATISQPADDDILSGTAMISGTVADANAQNSYFSITKLGGGVVKTSFYGDGRSVHNFNWDTTGVADGQYVICFEARDKAANKDGSCITPGASVKKVTVTVNNLATIKDDNTPVIEPLTPPTTPPTDTASNDTPTGTTGAQTVRNQTLAANDGTNDQAVLGAETTVAADNTADSVKTADPASSDESVLGTADANADKKSEAAGFLGLAWYWYIVAAAVLGGLWWLIAAVRRRSDGYDS